MPVKILNKNFTLPDNKLYKYSGRIDAVHIIMNGSNVTLCGKPPLAFNRASNKPDEFMCEFCLKNLEVLKNG